MAVNRGYKPAEQVILDDWYDPSLEMLAQVGSVGQKQIDEASGMLAKIGETQFQHLKADTPYAENVYKDIYAKIDKLAQGAMGDGDLRSVKNEIDKYQREVGRRFRPEGDIGAMVSNYTAFQKWNEELGKLTSKEFGKDGILSGHAAALRSKVLADYEAQGGIGQKDALTGYKQIGLKDAALSIDENALIETYGKGYIADSVEGAAYDQKTGQIKEGAMWQDQGKIWRKTSKGVKEVAYNDVLKDLTSALVNHEGYAQYLNQLNDLGISQYGLRSKEDLYVKDENGNVMVDDKGQATLDRNHPVVAAAMRGASKFGYKEVKYDDDIKFDAYDLAAYESGLRQKEERLKGQMMIYQSNSLQKDIKTDDIRTSLQTVADTKLANDNQIQRLQRELKSGNLNDAEMRLAQSQLNAHIQKSNEYAMQIRNSKATLANLAKIGGMDMKAEYEQFSKIAPKGPNGETLSFNQYQDIVTGAAPLPQWSMTVGADKSVAHPAVGMLASQREAAQAAQEKGSKIGIINTNDVILATPDTMLGKKMQEIENDVAAGVVNFQSADGTTSFNNVKFSQLIADGKMKLMPMATSVNGQPGFQLTVTPKGEKEGFRTITGIIPGVENQTWFQDLEVDLRDRAQAEGISTAKGANLNKQANMYSGMRAAATDAAGNNLGVGNLKSQVDAAQIELLDRMQESPDIFLPGGLVMSLTAGGDGTYVPTFYKKNPGVMGGNIPVRRDELEALGLPQGATSIDDLYSWIGESKKLQAVRQGPITR